MTMTGTATTATTATTMTTMTMTTPTRTFFLAFLLVFVTVLPVVTINGEVDFPPILDTDDIAYFFEQNDLDGLHWALSNVFIRSSRNPNDLQVVHELPDQIVSRGGGSTYTTAYKLKMDIEQAEYLVDSLKNESKAQYFETVALPLYEEILDRIPPLSELERTGGLYAFRPEDTQLGIQYVYNKATHLTNFKELRSDGDNGKPLPLLNPALDKDKLQKQWFGEDPDHENPGVIVVDDLLTDAALQRIHQIMLESTVWYQTKMPLKFGGYVGAYIDDGLHDRLLLALAFELHKALPRIMKGNPFRYLWAYKYDSDYTGINTHADEAAVNVNIWLTPDKANLDPDSGGLVVYTAKPPADWNFAEYNTNTDFVREKLLEPTGFANVTVPYRQNRAVIFDSALFHKTDDCKFKQGYKNRRINLTLLYGKMQRGSSDGRDSGSSSGNGGGNGGSDEL